MSLTSAPLVSIAAGLVAGGALGALYFATLHWNVQRLTSGAALTPVIVMQLLRFAVLAAALYLLARHGMPMLVAALAGLLLARAWVIRRVKR